MVDQQRVFARVFAATYPADVRHMVGDGVLYGPNTMATSTDDLVARLVSDPAAHDGFCGCQLCRAVGQCLESIVDRGVVFVCQGRLDHREDFHTNFNDGAPVRWTGQERSHA